MRKLLETALLFALAVLAASPALAQVEAFKYDAARVPVGKVYHYLKTNVDGTIPEHVSIRVAGPNRIESYKFHPGEPPAALVIADMDWAAFSVRSIESLHLLADGSRKTMATLTALDGGKRVKVDLPMLGKPPDTVEIGRIPWHIYNFDLASLAFAMPHLVDPKGRFTIGIADPNFGEGPVFLYRGEAEVAYVGEETRAGVLCRKYRIDGPALRNRGGFLWINHAEGHVEDIEIDLPDNPNWKSFKLKLTGVESMGQAAWERFQKAKLQPAG
ncbi:MAG TPA: hypothetical protein VN493_24200 [Thermoanaerobaculia bacterium]|nr:hypothetical protein [Thermoanaerobaculia bacterium]